MDNIIIGRICQKYRQEKGYRQKDVAADTGYTVENISAFERGITNNMKIFIWYLSIGLTYEELKKWHG